MKCVRSTLCKNLRGRILSMNFGVLALVMIAIVFWTNTGCMKRIYVEESVIAGSDTGRSAVADSVNTGHNMVYNRRRHRECGQDQALRWPRAVSRTSGGGPYPW